jgi:hypothetical protein
VGKKLHKSLSASDMFNTNILSPSQNANTPIINNGKLAASNLLLKNQHQPNVTSSSESSGFKSEFVYSSSSSSSCEPSTTESSARAALTSCEYSIIPIVADSLSVDSKLLKDKNGNAVLNKPKPIKLISASATNQVKEVSLSLIFS